MSNIKEIVARNIQQLRKQHKMTQLELSEKLNYSDKAISRWEGGEVLPDVEVLNKLAEIYGVHISVLFDNNLSTEKVKKLKGSNLYNKTIMALLTICFIWTAATVIFVYSDIINNGFFWEIFVYAVPVTFLAIFIFNYMWGKRSFGFFVSSLFIWTTLASVYITFLEYNVWLIFLIGVPMQVFIILWSRLKIK